ncbi:hypothetical protein MNBD_GAMMA04-1787 [hydrothermal vent metagenome]|uniref:Uncharacterized protein n=1 Tax=hydrothermal vent metagenome TaxID=652676 RepID=A0A3B0X229_9ZZZZ
MKTLLNTVITLITLLFTMVSFADQDPTEGMITLSYSDGRTDTSGLNEINKALKVIGVRVNEVPLPIAAKPLLKISQKRALNKEETAELLSHFSLHRGQLLDIIAESGRTPEAHRGGYLTTSEIGVPPYPKVYDMKALTPEVMQYLQVKFGKLHVNSADNGMGIDEVMTLVSGGEWTWFFLLPEDVIGKLTLGHVGLDGKGWRISYPGLVPHGGYLDPEHGLVVAHAHGPKSFVMRYEDPSVNGAKMLNGNSWIDFTGKAPKLLD